MTLCGFLLILSLYLLCGDCTKTKHLEISAGHVFHLNCDTSHVENDVIISVNWTRELNQDWDAEIKVIDQSLWFFPARESHSGNYSCYFSDSGRPSETPFSISVAKLECPRATSDVFLVKKRRGHLTCDSQVMKEIGKLNSVSIVSWSWMKDCRPLSWHKNRIQFHSVSENNDGVYTCVMNFTLNGTSYTAAQSMQVRLTDLNPVPQKPRVVKPRQETLSVKLGSKQVLNCKVFVGPGSCETDHVETINPYWLLNGKFVDANPDEISVEEYCTTENSLEYRHSKLTIFKVKEEFLNIPLQCFVLSSSGRDNGTVVLIPSREKELYVTVAVFTAFAVAALLIYQFRVDLVLAYRRLGPCLKQQNDGKLYDAYVTYPHADDQSVSLATTFALHVLPEVLEDRFGYKLFINDRDAPPGTAAPDAISETVGKSRRLIVILTPETFTKASESEVGPPPKHSSVNNNITSIQHDPIPCESSRPNWGPYECQVGLYDALVKECLQVILVQVGGDVDEALLPESLRYVKHTQGILKWKQHFRNKTNGRFWKQMRYRMPPVQTARPGLTV